MKKLICAFLLLIFIVACQNEDIKKRDLIRYHLKVDYILNSYEMSYFTTIYKTFGDTLIQYYDYKLNPTQNMGYIITVDKNFTIKKIESIPCDCN